MVNTRNLAIAAIVLVSLLVAMTDKVGTLIVVSLISTAFLVAVGFGVGYVVVLFLKGLGK